MEQPLLSVFSHPETPCYFVVTMTSLLFIVQNEMLIVACRNVDDCYGLPCPGHWLNKNNNWLRDSQGVKTDRRPSRQRHTQPGPRRADRLRCSHSSPEAGTHRFLPGEKTKYVLLLTHRGLLVRSALYPRPPQSCVFFHKCID